jgi:hypothetical protein
MQAEALLGQTEAHSQAQAQEVASLRTAIAQLERELATKDTTLDVSSSHCYCYL